jgi:hypothetical protein
MVLAVGVAAAQEQEYVQYIPAIASAPGVGDSFFVTDARVFNPDPVESITVQLAFLKHDANNVGVAEIPIDIGPRQGVALNDVVVSVFGLSGVGGLRLRSDSRFFATSRTYNVGGAEGTFGQFIPAQSPDEGLERGILLQVVNDPAMSGFRANVGFANPNTFSVTVTLRVVDADTGNLLGEFNRTLKPISVRQINDVFAVVGVKGQVFGNAVVEFEASAPVLGYASVADNTSDDPIYVMPLDDTEIPVEENDPPDGMITSPSGDVTIEQGGSVSLAGSVSDQLDHGLHTFGEAGSFTVTLTATDEHGLSDPTPDSILVTVEEAAEEATFTRVQSEIFSPGCARSGCHGNGSANGGLQLDAGLAYGEIVNVPSSQQGSLDRIEPGDPDNSYLWRKVNGGPGISGGRMPLTGGQLSQSQLDLLEAWILDGALND